MPPSLSHLNKLAKAKKFGVKKDKLTLRQGIGQWLISKKQVMGNQANLSLHFKACVLLQSHDQELVFIQLHKSGILIKRGGVNGYLYFLAFRLYLGIN